MRALGRDACGLGDVGVGANAGGDDDEIGGNNPAIVKPHGLHARSSLERRSLLSSSTAMPRRSNCAHHEIGR